MAETTKTAAKAKAAKTTQPKATAQPVKVEDKEEKVTFVAKDVDPHTYITVKNGFQGTLIYISKRTGEKFVWDGFGDEQEMELMELRNAKNTSKKFFENNWFMFDDSWVIDYLGVKRYYKNAIDLEDFDSIFSKTPKEIEEQIGLLSQGQKSSIAYRARQLVAEEKIDSIKAITALEKALGIELVIR